MKKYFILPIIVAFIVLGTHSMLWGQSFLVPIYVTNGTQSDTLWIGAYNNATYGVDSIYGEKAALVPAPVAGFFDSRLVDPRGYSGGNFGQDRTRDIRHYGTALDLDSFKVNFQAGTGNGDSITFSWQHNLSTMMGHRWRLTNVLTSAPSIDVDMTTRFSLTVNARTYSSIFIRTSDTVSYRTFSMETLAKDGITDARHRLYYGKPVKPVINQVSFCFYIKNTDTSAFNGLHVEFRIPVNPATLTVTQFASKAATRSGINDKWDFSRGAVAPGDSVMICGEGIKNGAKGEDVLVWWWSLNGVRKPRHNGAIFTENILRYPMPNTVNAGLQLMGVAFPNKSDYLVVGSIQRADSSKFILHKTYADVLKSLISNPGKPGKELMHDSLASYLNSYDNPRQGGLRKGKPIYRWIKSLPPSKQNNRLFGQTLTLSLNVLFSETGITPIGFGQLKITIPTSPFNGETIDSVLSFANQYLTWGTVTEEPTVRANDLADLCTMINKSFEGPLDTTYWGGEYLAFSGAVPVGDLGGWLVRNPSATPKVIANLNRSTGTTPEQYSLEQNYPNPFNPTTTIEFTLPQSGQVKMEIYNILGEKVASLLNGENFGAGTNKIVYNAENMPSGVYFYRFYVNNPASGKIIFQGVKKMVLIK